MLTRLEVNGFKNLVDFNCSFGPYTCIAGQNSVGKSNIFDVIQFLSATTRDTFDQAAASIRSSTRFGNISDIFRRVDNGNPRMSIAAEMIVPNETKDDLNRTVVPKSTFLRYEITLELKRIETGFESDFHTIRLVSESLKYLKMSEANDKIPWLRGNKAFRESAIRNNRKGTHYILTEETSAGRKISVAQDGQTEYGQSRRGRATAIYPESDGAQRSALSEYGSADFPTVCAARKEIETWNLLALEPSAMRSSSSMTDPDHVSTQGGNLPKALFRLTEMGKQNDILQRVAHSVSGLVNFRELVLDYDQQRQQITLFGRTGEDPLLPARSLSDGTLRFLALCILQIDPSVEGLICLEEPENGIHPSNLGEMYSLLKSLAVDPELPVSEENPLRQVIVNTHSPTYVMLHRDTPEELLFANKRQVLAEVGANGKRQRTSALVLRPVGASEENWRRYAESGHVLPVSAVVDYLSQGIEGVQSLISFEWSEA